MATEAEILAARRANAERLRAQGVDLFPARVPRDRMAIGEILARFGTADAAALERAAQTVCVAGRIAALRAFGKMAFATLQADGERLQLWLRKDQLGPELWQQFQLYEVGDFAFARGPLVRTQKGELSVDVRELGFLAKTMRPLPEKWHGLVDVEARYRQRYLDLLANPEVRRGFVIRSRMISAMREWLDGRGFLEVETPILQPIYGGAHARPFTTHHHLLDQELYLRISFELYLKRLVIGGIDRVYEIGRDFRNEGVSKKHNPEFTMLEVYQAYADYSDMMELVEQMVAFAAERALGTTSVEREGRKLELAPPWPRRSMVELIREACGVDISVATELEALKAAVKQARVPNVDVPGAHTWAGLVDAVFSETVEPTLVSPTFVVDYPAALSPLAKRDPARPHMVERFEGFIGGMEICNAFSELNDPDDQRVRFQEQAEASQAGDVEAQPLDEDFLRALEHGMPPTGGMGLGIGRLAMIFAGASHIREVKLFRTCGRAMLEVLTRSLGFVSASLVALIALGFGAMFLFFSGSAALILGHFLRFVRSPQVALPAIAAGAAFVGALAWLLGAPIWWWPAAGQLACALVAWAGVVLVHWSPALGRALRWGFGALMVGCGALFIASLAVSPLVDPGHGAILLAALVVVLGAVGLWPLVLAGLVRHRIEKPVEWFIGLRYLVARRRQTFISIISVICVVGVALGVAVITVVLSVMNGFSAMWEEKVIGARAHFSVLSRTGDVPNYRELADQIRLMPGIVGATPFLASDAILRGHDGGLQAIMLKGVDPSSVGDATQLLQTIKVGSLADLEPNPAGDDLWKLPGLIVGAELANRFLLRVGDPLVLISPMGGQPTPLGPAPRLERFRVAGVFRSDFFQFDESFVYADLKGAQKFMKLGDVAQGIEVRTVDPYRSRQIAAEVESRLGTGGLYYTRDWKDYFPGFFQALKTERVMMFVLLSFIMVVAGFIIVATLIMMIMEKSQDIAILKTMGCPDEGILRVFAIEGFLIGVVGLALGIGMGLVITWNLDVIQSGVERTFGFDVLPANVYQLQRLPHAVEPAQLGLISLIAMVLSIGATLLPSWQASRLDPAEALRYE